MNDLETKLSEILRDGNDRARLLMLEKERRGVSPDALVFVGMANVASQWWCTQHAVFKSRAVEAEIFAAYLSARILSAHRLGQLTTLPTTSNSLLDVGDGITLTDVVQLSEVKKRELLSPHGRGRIIWEYSERTDINGRRARIINPNLPPEQKHFLEESARFEGARVMDPEEDPKLRGEMYQASRAEEYPTIGWHFPWGRYIVGGVPDGLAADFVYEYKTTRSGFLLRFIKPVALAQADLYGYFFQRPKKRVQILVVEENDTRTWESAIDLGNVERTLAEFARVEQGQPARSPVAWKCNKCEFKATCPISQAR